MSAFMHAINEDVIDRRIAPEEADHLAELRALALTPPKHIRVHHALPWMTAVRIDDTLWVPPELLEQARAEVPTA